MDNRLEIILHPVRMRILQTLLNGRKLATQQIKEKLPDIPTPTLYRHIQALVEHDVISIVEENQIRGTVEKVYALPKDNIFSREDIEKATTEEHKQYFYTFVMSLLTRFNEYISNKNANPLKDFMTYRQIQLYLTDDEYKEMIMTISKALLKHLENHKTEERKLYSINTIIIPNKES